MDNKEVAVELTKLVVKDMRLTNKSENSIPQIVEVYTTILKELETNQKTE